MYILQLRVIREPFDKFVDWRQCATALMQREAVTYAKL